MEILLKGISIQIIALHIQHESPGETFYLQNCKITIGTLAPFAIVFTFFKNTVPMYEHWYVKGLTASQTLMNL
jgi:hypothetical protein